MKTIKGFDLPSEMKALVLRDFNSTPQVQDLKVPGPAKGQVLIKMAFSAG